MSRSSIRQLENKSLHSNLRRAPLPISVVRAKAVDDEGYKIQPPRSYKAHALTSVITCAGSFLDWIPKYHFRRFIGGVTVVTTLAGVTYRPGPADGFGAACDSCCSAPEIIKVHGVRREKTPDICSPRNKWIQTRETNQAEHREIYLQDYGDYCHALLWAQEMPLCTHASRCKTSMQLESLNAIPYNSYLAHVVSDHIIMLLL